MATMNLYLPDALKAEMESVEGVNWSNVAQEAFRSAVNQQRTKSMNTEAIAARLRGTAGKSGTAYKRGFQEGQEWAGQEAEADDLEILEATNVDSLLSGHDGSAIAVATLLAQSMGADDASYFFGDEGLHDFRKEFPSRVTESRLKGFVDGALDVFRQVKGQL